MKPGGVSTVDLLARWNRGDGEALQTLLERNLPWIRNRVRSRIGPLIRAREESSDVVQEVVLEFLNYGPRFLLENGRHLRALLARIAENVIRGEHDRYSAQCRTLLRERPLPRDTVLDLTVCTDSRDQPSQAAARNEAEGRIRLALNLVDAEERNVLLMRHWERLSFEAIGRELGISEDAARMRFHRALARITRWVRLADQGRIHELLDLEEDGAS